MQRLLALDGLRGIAAFAVVFFHLLEDMPTTLFSSGYLAVDFFFVLSGFVLARTYEGKFDRGLSFTAYMARRIHRLYPAILAGVVLGLGVALARGANEQVWMAAALQAMMLPRLSGAVFPLNDVQWSLLFELFANAIHALIHKWLTPIVLGGVVAMSLVALWSLSIWRGTMNGGFGFDTFDLGLARVMFSFFAGVAIHRLASRPAPQGLKLSFLPAAILLTAALAIPAGQLAPALVYDLAITTFLWPSLVYAAVRAQQPQRLAGFADWSGRLSYPLYAVHFPFVTLMKPWLAAGDAPEAQRWLAAACVLALSILAAIAVERFIERPALSYAARRRARAGA